MSGNVFGEFFRVAAYGESHGAAVGCVVDGCPARVPLTEADLQAQLDRRRPGQSRLSTPRAEADRAVILSGVENGLTLGTPIAVNVANGAARSGDYAALRDVPRPGHADATTQLKYGIRASSGGGRASARETIGRVAAGAVAEAFLRVRCPSARIVAWVEQVGDVRMAPAAPAALERVTRADVDATPVRCPDPDAAARMADAIEAARADGDSLGGVAACLCTGFPAGLGEPVFDKLTAALAHAMMSIPATRGFEIGEGFRAASLRGSEHNDAYEAAPGGGIHPATNRAGGVLGGITTGEPIFFRVAFKPVPSIAKPQRTADFQGRPVELSVPGRHDPCVLPRAVPVVEAMAALVLADAVLAQAARTGTP
jgi:chorismate synthase